MITNSVFFYLRAAEKQNLIYLKNYLHVTLSYFYFSGFWKGKTIDVLEGRSLNDVQLLVQVQFSIKPLCGYKYLNNQIQSFFSGSPQSL